MLQDVTAGSMQVFGPTLGRIADCFESFDHFYEKGRARIPTAFAVPVSGLLHIAPCLRLNAVRLTCADLAGAPVRGDGLLPTESAGPSRSESRPRAA
jgi:hypothetical protein